MHTVTSLPCLALFRAGASAAGCSDKMSGDGLNVSFISVQEGKQVTVRPQGGLAKGPFGWTLYGEDAIGTDILPAIGEGDGTCGFVRPPNGP